MKSIYLVLILILYFVLYTFLIWKYTKNNTKFRENLSNTNNLEKSEIINITYNDKKVIPGKTIWLLWFTGWNNTPWVVQQVKKSWEILNPTWNIELVHSKNLRDYIDIPFYYNKLQLEAQLEIIKLKILSEHGGVWVDPSVLCFFSLDGWIYDALEPCGFWMYHDEYKNVPTSWFMVSLKENEITTKWYKKINNFWINKVNSSGEDLSYPHNLSDEIFTTLCNTDKQFLIEWNKVPCISANYKGLLNIFNNEYEGRESIKKIIKYTPPYVLRLIVVGFEKYTPDIEKTNTVFAIKCALEQKFYPYPLHDMKVIYPIKNKLSEYVAVSSDCGNSEGVEELDKICLENNIQLIIYDKCNFCKHIPKHINSRPLNNVGREQHTFLYFVIKYYDNLPLDIIFIPSNLKKHSRLDRFKKAIQNKVVICEPSLNSKKLGDLEPSDCSETLAEFEISEYEGKQIELADTRPFKKWFEKYVGKWNPELEGPCWNGIMRTNKTRILRHSKDFYINIIKQLQSSECPEVGFYLERSMALIF